MCYEWWRPKQSMEKLQFSMFLKITIIYNLEIKSTVITAKILMWDNLLLEFNAKESLFLKNLSHNNRKMQIKMNNSRINNSCECYCDGKILS